MSELFFSLTGQFLFLKFKQAIQLESVQSLSAYLEGRFALQIVHTKDGGFTPLRGELQEWECFSGIESENLNILTSPSFLASPEQAEEISALLFELERHISAYINEKSQYDEHAFGAIIGASSVMQRLFQRAQSVASTSSTVLIRGENGVGKDLLAQEIHEFGARKGKPFIAQNCAAIPSELIESEFFGHTKGAFSGALRDRDGLFVAANGGTLFLDEIGDMPLAMQTKLLRVVENGSFMPVGGNEDISVDVRLVFATHRDLQSMVEKGTFREDLYYRIKVLELTIPPLRERGDDVELLAKHFLRKLGRKGYPKKTLDGSAIQYLQTRSWPGNVRQLDNELERALIFSGDGDQMEAHHFSEISANTSTSTLNLKTTMPEQVEKLERALILLALKKHGWNKTQAAKTLGVSRRNLIRKVAKFELGNST